MLSSSKRSSGTHLYHEISSKLYQGHKKNLMTNRKDLWEPRESSCLVIEEPPHYYLNRKGIKNKVKFFCFGMSSSLRAWEYIAWMLPQICFLFPLRNIQLPRPWVWGSVWILYSSLSPKSWKWVSISPSAPQSPSPVLPPQARLHLLLSAQSH